MFKKVSIAVFSLVLSACASGYNPAYKYNEVVVVNNSNHLIQDVKISTSETGRSFSCGNIAPFGICANKFPPRRYQNSPIRVDWLFGNAGPRSSEFALEVPVTMYTAFPLRGVLAIGTQGEISAYFEQETPFN